MSTIAELLVKIGVKADTPALARFNEEVYGVGRATGRSRSGIAAFGTAIGAVTAVAAGAVTGMVMLANSTARTADVIAKNARRAGIGAEEFQRLAFAAKEADVSEGALIKSSNVLAAQLRAAAAGEEGGKGFTTAIEGIGVSLDDLGRMTKTQQFGAIADGLNKIEDESERAAAASEIFGMRLGPELANLLAMGSKGIEETGAALRNVFSQDELDSAESYQDALTEMGDAFDHVKTRAVIGMIPTMEAIVDRVSAFIDENEDLISQDLPAFMEGLTEVVADGVDTVATAVEEWRKLAVIFDEIEAVVTEVAQAFDAMSTAIRKALEDTLGFAKAEKVIESFKDTLRIGFGPATSALAEDFAGQGAVDRERAEAKRDQEREAKRSLKAIGDLTDRTRLGTDLYTAAGTISGKGAQGRRAAVEQIANDVIAGNMSPREARSAAQKLIRPPGRRGGGGGGGKGSRAAEHVPTADELVNAVAGGAGAVGKEGGPTPNVMITITNQNTFDFEVNQQFARTVTPEDVGRPLVEMIQREINKQNVEASRTIAPVVLR